MRITDLIEELHMTLEHQGDILVDINLLLAMLDKEQPKVALKLITVEKSVLSLVKDES